MINEDARISVEEIASALNILSGIGMYPTYREIGSATAKINQTTHTCNSGKILSSKFQQVIGETITMHA